MSKKSISKPFKSIGESTKRLFKGDIGGAGAALLPFNQGKPDVPGLPPAPDTGATLDQAANEEELKRKRRANIATRPLGVLVQQALQTRTLTGQ